MEIIKFHIRFNKSRGQEGRGSVDHVWRVFLNGQQELLVKHFYIIGGPVFSERTGEDWNLCCFGTFQIHDDTGTILISATERPL